MNAFWFVKESPRIAAIMRMALAGILLFDVARRWQLVANIGLGFRTPNVFDLGTFGIDPVIASTYRAQHWIRNASRRPISEYVFVRIARELI